MKTLPLTSGLLLTALLVGPANAATTFGSVSLLAQVTVNAGGTPSLGSDTAVSFDLTELPLQAAVNRSDQGPDSSASASADLSTDFASASAGAFIFESIFATYAGSPGTVGGASALGTAQYRFFVSTSTIATINYSLLFEGNTGASTIRISQANEDVFRINPTSSGSLVTAAFGPGDYDLFVSIAGSAGSSTDDASASRAGRVAFSFADAGVPEPATWAMMIGGMGAAGVALRRRKANVSVRYA